MTITFDEALLSASDEIRLAMSIEAGVLAEQALVQAAPRAGATDAELEELRRQGDAAFGRLVRANLRLVAMITGPLAARRHLDPDDLFQEGVLGLLEAVRRFDHTRGARFATFALPWIRMRVGELAVTRDGEVGLPPSRAKSWVRVVATQEALMGVLGRSPTDAELATELDRTPAQVRTLLQFRPPVRVGAHTWVFDAVDSHPNRDVESLALHRLLHTLPRVDRTLIERLYGVGGAFPHSHQEVADALGVSVSTVRRRERAALERLRRAHCDEVA